MINIFNRKELCIVFSMAEQSNIRQTLSENDIEYQIKTINRLASSPFASGTRSRSGSFGQNMDLNYEYIFFVYKKDYDKAKRILARH